MARRHLKDFSRQQIKKIATEYAKTPLDITHTYFEERYDISGSTFYGILKNAVIKGIVEDDIVEKMAYKAQENSREKAGDAGAFRSNHFYDYLKKRRRIFELTLSEKIEITIKYSKSNLDKHEFAKRNALTVKLLQKTLLSALTENMVDDATFETIRKKALKNNSADPNTIDFWKKIEELRNNNSQAK